MASMKKNLEEDESEEESEEGESEQEGKEKESTKQAQPNPLTGPKPGEGDGEPVTMEARLMATMNPSTVTRPKIRKITCIYKAAGSQEECGLRGLTLEEFHKHIKEVHDYELTGGLRWESTKVQSGYTAEELEGLELEGKERTVATKRKPEEDDDVKSTLQAGQKETKYRKHGRGRSRSRKVRSASETPPRIARRKIMFNADAKKGAVDTRAESQAATSNQVLPCKANIRQEAQIAATKEDHEKGLDSKSTQDEVDETDREVESAGDKLQACAVAHPLTEERPLEPSQEAEALEVSKELEEEKPQEDRDAVKDWTKKDANDKHSLLGEISQMHEVLEQLPDVMESDAFPLPNATMEEEKPEERGGNDEGKTPVTTEVGTTIVVKTPDAAGEGEIEVVQLESDDSEADGSERENSEEELPLEEATDIVQQETEVTEDNTKADTTGNSSKNEEGNGTEKGTADQAGPPDGGATL